MDTKLIEVLEKTGLFVDERVWNKKPRKNYLGRILGVDLWIKTK